MRKRPVLRPGLSKKHVSKRKDKRVFSKTAQKSHYLNTGMNMRGGIRL